MQMQTINVVLCMTLFCVCGALDAAEGPGNATTAPLHGQIEMAPPSTEPFVPDDLNDPSAIVRLKAVLRLRQSDPALRKYDDALLKAAQTDGDPKVRAAAAMVLGTVYSKPESPKASTRPLTDAVVIDGLCKLLDDPDFQVKRATARALASFGPRAAGALQKIRALLDDPKCATISLSLSDALLSLDPSGSQLQSFLRASNDDRAKAAAVLAYSLRPGDEYASQAATYLKDNDPKLRGAAIVAVARMRVKDPSIILQVIVLTKDPDDHVRADACRAMCVLGTNQQAATVLQSMANETSVDVKRALILIAHRLHSTTDQSPTTQTSTSRPI